MFCCGHSHHDLKDGIYKLVKFGIDMKLIPSLIHSDSLIPFPNASSDNEYISKYILAIDSLALIKVNDLNIKGLELFKNLRTISFISCKVDELQKLLDFPKLTDLLFCDCEFSNFDELLIFKNKIEGLEFSSMPNSADLFLGLIKSFSKLKKLSLCDNKFNGNELECFSYLKELEELNLDDNNISSFEYINYLSNLKKLSLDNNQLTSIENLNLKNLEEIQLSNNHLKSLKNLSGYRLLKHIAINNNHIDSVNDLTAVDSLICIEIADNPFTDREIKEELLDVEFIVAFE